MYNTDAYDLPDSNALNQHFHVSDSPIACPSMEIVWIAYNPHLSYKP